MLLAEAQWTTGLVGLIASGEAGLIASREAFDQESSVMMFGDAVRQKARSVQRALAVCTMHWQGPKVSPSG